MYIISKQDDNLYRPNVACVILSNDGVFAARRVTGESNIWQMPQGGVNKGEELEEAMLRELMEEIGTNNVRILRQSKYNRYYKIPQHLIHQNWQGKYIGQKQRWFLAEFTGNDSDINVNTPNPEFSEWRWFAANDVIKQAVHFKRDLYRDVFAEFNIKAL